MNHHTLEGWSARTGLLRSPGRWWAAGVMAINLLGGASALAAPFTITAPIQVPLHWIPLSQSGVTVQKLGIYVALGGSSTPQLFEFDTGGSGFYAAHSSSVPWWGSDVQRSDPYRYFSQGYDSGNTYTGDVVITSLSLFSSSTAAAPSFTATDVLVGKAKHISNGSGTVWSESSTVSTAPPLLGAFWGDFGMAPKQGDQGARHSDYTDYGGPTIDSLVSQLAFGSGVSAGYRVHASAADPWVQFGLSGDDLSTLSTTYTLNPASGSSPTDVSYTASKVITGNLALSLGSEVFANPQTGIIFDTGAFTTIHQGSSSTTPPTALPSGMIATGSLYPTTYVQPGTQVQLESQPVGLGVSSEILSFAAGTTFDQDLVGVQSDSYYFNTGILPFLSNDIIYNLSAMQLTLVPQSAPVPAPLGLSGVVAAAALSRRIRVLRGRLGCRDQRR